MTVSFGPTPALPVSCSVWVVQYHKKNKRLIAGVEKPFQHLQFDRKVGIAKGFTTPDFDILRLVFVLNKQDTGEETCIVAVLRRFKLSNLQDME